MTTFYLVRHAHSDLIPDENRPLSTQGRDDANRVADSLQHYPISAIYSSPFRRAHETIMPLAKRLGLTVHIEPELRERELGNSTTEDFLEAVEATWQDLSFVFPEGESNTAAQQRGLAFIQNLQTQQGVEHIVLSSHGNLITLILQSIDPSVGFSFWKSLTRPDIYVFRQNQIDKLILGRLWKEVGNI